MTYTRFNISKAMRGTMEETAMKALDLLENIPYGVDDVQGVLVKVVEKLPDDKEDYRDTLVTIAAFCVTMVAIDELKEANENLAKVNKE